MRVRLTDILNLAAVLILLLGGAALCPAKSGEDGLFYVLNSGNGLLDDGILQIMQLPDGRMAVFSTRGVNILADQHFLTLPADSAAASPIAGYKGHVHLYADSHDRLWIKDYGRVGCVDLPSLRWVRQPLARYGGATDFFVDSRRAIWLVRSGRLCSEDSSLTLLLPASLGDLQDMDADDRHVYTFHSSGTVVVFDRLTGKSVGQARAYPEAQAGRYRSTSLVSKAPDGQFYQIRTGPGGSIFLHFNPRTRSYAPLFSCRYVLHTLNMASARQALISSEHGYLMFDLSVSNKPREVSELSLPDGTSLTTGINTVCRDRDGGIWFGTYRNGVIYVSPYLGLFFKADRPWWRGGAVIAIVVVALIAVAVVLLLIVRRKRQTVAPAAALTADSVAAGQSDETAVPEEAEILRKARDLIGRHLAESGYGVEQLARELCMERTGLYKKLKAAAGETPVNFIRNVRLDRAAEMLRRGDMPVSEVAERTGFSSPGYFAKCFKSRFGKSPSEFAE